MQQALRITAAAASGAATAYHPGGGPDVSLALGPVTIERWTRSPHCSSGDGAYQLLIQLAGSAVLARNGVCVPIAEDHWQVHNPASWPVVAASGSDQIAIRFSARLLSSRVAGSLHGLIPSARRLDGTTRLILDVARSCLAQSPPIQGAVGAALGESLLELVKLALIERLGPGRLIPVRETVRTRIESFIQRNLINHDLSIDMIAERMKCTKRYLHKVFSEEGETLNHFIWTQRLERCRTDLERPELAGRSITEIAFGWGFSNAAHFSRSFRSRYGQSPRAYRLARSG